MLYADGNGGFEGGGDGLYAPKPPKERCEILINGNGYVNHKKRNCFRRFMEKQGCGLGWEAMRCRNCEKALPGRIFNNPQEVVKGIFGKDLNYVINANGWGRTLRDAAAQNSLMLGGMLTGPVPPRQAANFPGAVRSHFEKNLIRCQNSRAIRNWMANDLDGTLDTWINNRINDPELRCPLDGKHDEFRQAAEDALKAAFDKFNKYNSGWPPYGHGESCQDTLKRLYEEEGYEIDFL